jgi:hypothetical protein
MKVKTLGNDIIDTSKYQQAIKCKKLEIGLSRCFCKSACCFVLAARPDEVSNKGTFCI